MSRVASWVKDEDLFSDPAQQAAEYAASSPNGDFFRERLRLVADLLDRHSPSLPGDPERTLLDVGCGPGMLVETAVNRQMRFVGVDLSFPMALACHRRLRTSRNGQALRGNAEALPLASAAFDLVLCMGILEYVPSIGAALRELHRVLRPGGLLIASMLNPRSPYRIWLRLSQPELCKLTQPYVYPEPTLVTMTEASGFRVLEREYYDFNLLLSPLDDRFPRVRATTSRALSGLARSPLRWLGTGYLFAARKHCAAASGR
jgi:ubiquinone/menaquinone biosynthesis C-methylase UbiE